MDFWIVVGLFAWLAILILAACLARVAKKPWPDHLQRFNDDDES